MAEELVAKAGRDLHTFVTAADPRYVEARRVLLNALDVLSPHLDAVVIAGAQAVYLRAGPNSLPVADYTTDGDLALDPTILLDEPALEMTMVEAGFSLAVKEGAPEPGLWVADTSIDGVPMQVGIDLIVPDAVAQRPGRRGALLPPHGKRAARRVVGLEAALVDNDVMTIAALDPSDGRSQAVKVASVSALIVAKVHKIADRLAGEREERQKDKDAADVVRLMQAEPATSTASSLSTLTSDPIAGATTIEAIAAFESLFGSRAGRGIAMASRSLRTGMPEERVRTLCLAYAAQLRENLAVPR